MKINVWHSIEQRTIDASDNRAVTFMTQNAEFLPKADILNTNVN